MYSNEVRRISRVPIPPTNEVTIMNQINHITAFEQTSNFSFDGPTSTKIVDTALNRYHSGRKSMHFAACVAASYAKEHGDVTLLERLVKGMKRTSQTRVRLAAWVRHHCTYKDSEGKVRHCLQATVNIEKNTVTVRVDTKNTDKINIKAMFDKPYWEVIKVSKATTDYELRQSTLAFVRKAHAHKSGDVDIQKELNHAFLVVAAEEKAKLAVKDAKAA